MVTDRHALKHDLKPSSPILDLILILANYNQIKKYFKAIIPLIPIMAHISLCSAFSHLTMFSRLLHRVWLVCVGVAL